MHDGYHFWGIHLFWWFFWVITLIWIFASPFSILGKRVKKDKPQDVLKKRFASGEITYSEYQEKKNFFEKN